MVAAEARQAPFAGEREVGNDPLAGLDDSLIEVRDGDPAAEHLGRDPVRRPRDDNGQRLVGFDELQGELGVLLVALHRVWQAQGNEPGGSSLIAQLRHGPWCEHAHEGGMLPAGDTMHVPVQPRALEVFLEEIYSTADLRARVDLLTNPQFGRDLLL